MYKEGSPSDQTGGAGGLVCARPQQNLYYIQLLLTLILTLNMK